MLTCRIENTGEEFTSLAKLAKRLGCSVAWVSWRMNHRAESAQHFTCRGEKITIVGRTPIKDPKIARRARYERERERLLAYAREWHKNHKNYNKEWREKHPEEWRAYQEKWRKEHQDWYNAYWREYRRKKKENKSLTSEN